MLNKIKSEKLYWERKLQIIPIMEAFWKVFILGNFILGVTSGMFNRAFYMILKYTDFKHLYFWYGVRYVFYFWVVFYGGFSLILLLKRITEFPRYMVLSIYFYILFSLSCLVFWESFLPFQILGGELFDVIYKALKHL